jgi:hypothetical protein
MMTKKVISTVQEYLTVVSDNKCYQIVNVELLLRRHPPEAVIAFLEQLKSEYKKELGQLIRANKTDEKINVLVAKNWRIKMAVITIKNANNVQDAA